MNAGYQVTLYHECNLFSSHLIEKPFYAQPLDAPLNGKCKTVKDLSQLERDYPGYRRGDQRTLVAITRDGVLVGDVFPVDLEMTLLQKGCQLQMASLEQQRVLTATLLTVQDGVVRVRFTTQDREWVQSAQLTRRLKAAIYQVNEDRSALSVMFEVFDWGDAYTDSDRQAMAQLAEECCQVLDRGATLCCRKVPDGSFSLEGPGTTMPINVPHYLFSGLTGRRSFRSGVLEYEHGEGGWIVYHNGKDFSHSYGLDMTAVFPPRPVKAAGNSACLSVRNGGLNLTRGSVSIGLVANTGVDTLVEIYSMTAGNPLSFDDSGVKLQVIGGVMHAEVTIPGLSGELDWEVRLPGDMSEFAQN